VKKSTVFQVAGGVALAGVSLWIFLKPYKDRHLDFSVVSSLWKNLCLTPFWVIAGGIALTILTLWLRSVRWNLILPKSPSASRQNLFGLVMIGFLVNNILPARLGEAARMLLLWKRNRFTVAASVGSVLLERIFDILVFLSFFFIPALFCTGLRQLIPYAIPLASAAGAVLFALVFYAFFPSQSRALGRSLIKHFPLSIQQKTLKTAGELTSNLNWISSPGKCLAMVLLSVGMIACHPAILILLVRDALFGVLYGMFAAATAAIGAAIPLSPGYVGTLHAVLKQGLVLCGVEPGKAMVVATLYHAIGYVTVMVVGLYFFLRLRISFKEIGGAKDELDKEGSSAATPATKADKKDPRQ
jgi:glycosyltransferase 2 family protein